ncbi:hypothetical protein B296_00031934 [Ensete ventricosum]|uniref:Uncharacterized protein n=1 Tax=Ensete ventricosum TaxID=4639 RepID=A0A426ZHW3_ENSVE|nr:hypothetical protein B296_00031934 [Ensete ventricosum]
MPAILVVRRALAGGGVPTLPVPGRLYGDWRHPNDQLRRVWPRRRPNCPRPAPAAKGLDGQSVLKRSCNLSFFSVALREAFPWFICFRHTSDYSIDLIFEGASGFCDDLLPCHDILSFFSVLLTLS